MLFDWINEIYKKLDEYIKIDTKLYLGVSWWSDSMLLFFVIKEYFLFKNYNLNNIFILHYNHNFREESIHEENNLKNFFEWYNFITETYSWNDFRENILRETRYNFYLKHIDGDGLLLLWHNLTDRIETTFMNMMRGSNINGIINMGFFTESFIWSKKIKIIRPLINIPKDIINSICDLNSILYFIDKTNFDVSFSKRNLIRNEIISMIAANSNTDSRLGNKFFQSFLNLYEIMESLNKNKFYEFTEINSSIYWESEFSYSYNWDIEDINSLVELLKSIWIYSNIYTNTLLELMKFVSNSKSWFKYFNEVYIFKSHWILYFIKAPINFYKKNIEQQIKITKLWLYKIWDFEIEIVDEKLIWLVIRFPKLNDIYKSKTLNKYFINNKIPIFWRNFVPIVADDNIVKFVFKINI